ncbi:hypothetical protein FDZ73_24190 [bacterium]|nr:MAG: hypothetical protein FDZ73_24190 [bacterium]
MSRKFVTWADEQQVKTVVAGDVEGVQRNTSKRKKANPKKKRRTRQQNQHLSQWPFGLLLLMLSYKLESSEKQNSGVVGSVNESAGMSGA